MVCLLWFYRAMPFRCENGGQLVLLCLLSLVARKIEWLRRRMVRTVGRAV